MSGGVDGTVRQQGGAVDERMAGGLPGTQAPAPSHDGPRTIAIAPLGRRSAAVGGEAS